MQPNRKNVIIGVVVLLGLLAILGYSQRNSTMVQSLISPNVTPTAAQDTATDEAEEEEQHQDYSEPVITSESQIIDIYPDGFEPKTLTVTIGETVAIKNETEAPFRVVAHNKSFDSGDIPVGEQISVVSYSKPGTYTYYSFSNPSMTGTIVVTGK